MSCETILLKVSARSFSSSEVSTSALREKSPAATYSAARVSTVMGLVRLRLRTQPAATARARKSSTA